MCPSSSTPERPSSVAGHFQRFMFVWHTLVFGTMAFMLTGLWSGSHEMWRKLVVTSMVLIQAVLYLIQFAGVRRGKMPRDLAAYFSVALLLCLGEWLLVPVFGWMTMMYIGQMTGLLPPKRSLPVCILIALVFDPPGLGLLHPERLTVGAAIPRLLLLMSILALGSFVYLLGAASRQQRQLIKELNLSKAALEAAREKDLELAALRERERLARDLHDSLGHALVTLTVQLQAVQRLLVTDPERTTVLLEDMQKLTRASMEDLRRSLANLRAPGLGERPLVSALKSCGDDFARRSGITVRCDIDDGADLLPPRLSEVLWRVGQESLANAERHAQARTVSLTLRLNEKEILLRVDDDGVGLSPDAETKPSHYGLRGLRERVEGVGGSFTLSAGQTGGTVVEARIPRVG